jgi:hypothetical protein
MRLRASDLSRSDRATSTRVSDDWTAHQARNLVMQLGDEHPFRFLIHDRDTKFSNALDEILRTEGIKVIRTPVKAQNANAFAERWVRKVRADCLDRILIVGRRHRRNPPGDDRDLHAADCDGRAAARQA